MFKNGAHPLVPSFKINVTVGGERRVGVIYFASEMEGVREETGMRAG